MDKLIEKLKCLLVALFGFTETVENIMPLKKPSSKRAVTNSVRRKACRKKR